MKQVAIIAGGKGTRLASRLNGLPKCLIPIGKKFLLHHQFEWLRREGIEKIAVFGGYDSRLVGDFINTWGWNGICFFHEGKPMGTAGNVLQCLDIFAEDFFVIYGDLMADVKLRRMMKWHKELKADATLLVHETNHPQDSHLIRHDQHVIRSIHNPGQEWRGCKVGKISSNAGIYVVRRDSLPRALPGQTDWMGYVFPKMIQDGKYLAAYDRPEYCRDIGTPERYDQVCADYEAGRIFKSCVDCA